MLSQWLFALLLRVLVIRSCPHLKIFDYDSGTAKEGLGKHMQLARKSSNWTAILWPKCVELAIPQLSPRLKAVDTHTMQCVCWVLKQLHYSTGVQLDAPIWSNFRQFSIFLITAGKSQRKKNAGAYGIHMSSPFLRNPFANEILDDVKFCFPHGKLLKWNKLHLNCSRGRSNLRRAIQEFCANELLCLQRLLPTLRWGINLRDCWH